MRARVDVVNLREKLDSITEHWRPVVAGELNGQQVRLAKFLGEFVPHAHAEEDELFLVLSGSIEMRLPGRTVLLNEGEFLIVPRGVEHCPHAEKEAAVLLFEPAKTRRTGDAGENPD